VSGLELARRFYAQAVAPLLGGVTHAAGLLGEGSEVLGYDDAVSADHDFGPRVQVFLADPGDTDKAHDLLHGLPATFDGLPVAFAYHGAAPAHQVTVTTAAAFFGERLGFDPAGGVGLADWLLTPTQVLASLTAGAVFTDPDGVLRRYREALRWYPDDVWRYALAAGWLRVAQEEPFVARAGSAGDDLGSRLLAARLSRDLIRLTFLVERCWAPYPKWLGRAFTGRRLAGRLRPLLAVATSAVRWQEREGALTAAAGLVAAATNELGLAEPVDPAPRRFFDRDIEVLGADRFTVALTAAITDPGVRGLLARLGSRGPVTALPGTIDQVTDSTDVLCSPRRCRAAAPLLGLGDHS
jgi:hypothetical protein